MAKNAITKAAMAVALASILMGCSSRGQAPQNAIASPITDDSILEVGMTFDDVEARWGDTDCVYETSLEGHALDAWGYERAIFWLRQSKSQPSKPLAQGKALA